MPAGPGKYDDLCTMVLEQAAAEAAIVVVKNGRLGSGFSVQAHGAAITALGLAEVLETVAAEIRASVPTDEPEEARPMQMDLTCPHCGKQNTEHSSFEEPGARPDDGSLSLCIDCGLWGVFEGAAIRRPSAGERADIEANPKCAAYVKALRQVKSSH